MLNAPFRSLAMLLTAAPAIVLAQTGVGIGTTTPNASAALDVSSTTKGLLPPRMSQTQRDAINPATTAAGLTVYNTTTGLLNTWDGTKWVAGLADTSPPPAAFVAATSGQTYVVPAGVTSVLVDVAGAQGGSTLRGNAGGNGGRVQATLAVVPGETLAAYFGYGGATSTSLGSSGGGAADVRQGGTALANRVVVAGGGGGGGKDSFDPANGGAGGGTTGGAGGNSFEGSGGGGGTASAGGAGGINSYNYNGSGGSLGAGGSGNNYSGGGGGGYYGGGGGAAYAGGGGGSSYAGPGTSAVTHTQGYQAGAAYVRITPVRAAPAPVLDAASFINTPWTKGNAAVYPTVLTDNVGVGTTTPGHPLTVQAGAASNSPLLGFYSQAGADKFNFSLAGGGLNLSESGVAGGRLFVKPGGNVGIGTTTPGQTLDVNGNANVSGNTTVSGNVGIGTSSPAGGLHVDRPEASSLTALGVLLSGGSIGNPGLELRGDGKTPYLDFVENTNLDYTTRLLSFNGTLNVLYGGTAPKPGTIFNVQGGLQATAVNNTSDARLKQHVRPLTGALASVQALRGVRYEWNELGVQHGGTAGVGQVGLIAQEVEAICPELVNTDAQGYKAVNYAQLTPVLIEAIKEQQAQIESLKTQNAVLKAEATATTEAFEARLRRLEAVGEGQARK